MKRVTASLLRKRLGKVLDDLAGDGEPVVIQVGRRPRAVLMALDQYERRFRNVRGRRRQIAQEILASRVAWSGGEGSVVDLIRNQRGPLP